VKEAKRFVLPSHFFVGWPPRPFAMKISKAQLDDLARPRQESFVQTMLNDLRAGYPDETSAMTDEEIRAIKRYLDDEGSHYPSLVLLPPIRECDAG
jgi:hypothetical protein